MTQPDQLAVEDIMHYLPHRYPFLLVDRILQVTPGKFIKGLKNVTLNEPFFQGHFPGRPVMPGVLICEAMAQVGGVLAYMSTQAHLEKKLYFFVGMDKVRFRRPVVPGDQLIMEMTTIRGGKKVWKMLGKALVEDNVVAEGEFMAALSREESPADA
ncbi:3-hydroxyacyl-ACP dehydratase FabZ [Desulfobacca acetoxidans]|uniref:3-hydroxyacyl-[acyl-carrier-protein] dehydratase FabZ n=1 Tax=Desulfobacca acetoxidans (strain ATCC 700848 / DSM 11109 / ASRB2) TaxID=880072 RepID=F2NIQ5_DESAR|nr:3-hydroxyacyl-ACP dehydratase FabZ [Desulfobacca acetoxidans]AEB10530.1 (3R)-hydroxymyristoyl-(acyl-carrier-protein)dehydratase [Desulfobacca acetoxidans DSM 11109]HAY23332.1 3-hydroxyacyl-[acyl-carrier-protein] dehydratase FabZ [Desulfobacterales bacterium]